MQKVICWAIGVWDVHVGLRSSSVLVYKSGSQQSSPQTLWFTLGFVSLNMEIPLM